MRHLGDKTPDSTEPQTERTGEEEREFEAEETEDRESLLSTIGEPKEREWQNVDKDGIIIVVGSWLVSLRNGPIPGLGQLRD